MHSFSLDRQNGFKMSGEAGLLNREDHGETVFIEVEHDFNQPLARDYFQVGDLEKLTRSEITDVDGTVGYMRLRAKANQILVCFIVHGQPEVTLSTEASAFRDLVASLRSDCSSTGHTA